MAISEIEIEKKAYELFSSLKGRCEYEQIELIEAALTAAEKVRPAVKDCSAGEPSIQDLLAWIKSRPGCSWVATAADVEKAIAALSSAPAAPVQSDGWRDIASAPAIGEIEIKVMHGASYFETRARFIAAHNGWISIDPDSSVGYIIGGKHSVKHPAYWRPDGHLPTSPAPKE